MPPALSTSSKRLTKELKEIKSESGLPEVSGPKSDSSLYEWSATIAGPSGSPYEGGLWTLDVSIPSDYPFRAPRLQFKTRIYHPNINAHGAICLDILKSTWSPALSIVKVLLSISSLLTDPNPDDPLVGEIAAVYKNNRPQFDRTAREWTKKFATPQTAPITIPDSPKPSTRAASSNAAATATSTSTSNEAKPKPPVIELD